MRSNLLVRGVVLALLLRGAVFAQEGYFPARVGLSWTYSNGETQTLSGTRTFEGEEVFVLTHYYGGAAVSEDYLSYGPDAVRSLGTAAAGQTLRYDPPLLIYRGGLLAPGQHWDSRTVVGGFEITLTSEVLGVLELETPAGSFEALHIRQRTVTDGGEHTVLDLYFVPGVGVVRFVMSDGSAVELVEKNF
ncbi:MAG: hypothetical protein M3511_02170 [Deinococcota bacterium]|jgi:hypothetical protein|nr:hypothetical protein [Deinococcota bacterium]